MLKRHPKLLGQVAQVLDVFTIGLAFVLAFPFRSLWRGIYSFGGEVEVGSFYLIIAVLVFIWWALLKFQGSYGPQRYVSFAAEISRIAKTTLLGAVIFLSLAYLIKWQGLPRTLFLSFVVLSFVLLSAEKFLWHSVLNQLRKKGRNHISVLIVGATEIARRFIDSINRFSDWGLAVVGFLVKSEMGHRGDVRSGVATFLNAPILGSFHDLTRVLHQHSVDEVIFALPTKDLEDIKEMMDICEVEGVKTRIISNFFSGLVFKAEADVIHGIPIITYSPAPRKACPAREWQLLVKRTVDIGLSSIALILLSPLFAVITLAIKLTSPGPIFYRWRVVGLNKRPFTGYKFRTMVVNADEIKEKLLDENEINGPVFKLREDPRVTRVGRFLRKFSLDELPQLWSVFKGDMSLVGPHPPLETELHRFEGWQRRKLSVKPGITCLWQVNGRSNIRDFDEWVRMDLEYIDKWSLWLDFKILVRTVPAVVSGRGAY